MSHKRHFAIALALAAARLIPGHVPVLGGLTRSGWFSFSASAAFTYAFVGLARGGGGRSRQGRVDPDETYEEWTRKELYSLAQDLDIPGRSQLDKQGLIEAIRSHT